MAILSKIQDFMLYLKESTGYVLYRLSAKCVAMENGNDLQTEIDTINNNLTNKLEWKSTETVTGDTYLTLPTEFTEMIITTYIYTDSSKVYQMHILKSQLSNNEDVYFVGSYYASSSDFGFGNINISQTKAKIRNFYYAGKNYTSTASMLIRYR